MVDSLDVNIPISVNGYPSSEFEVIWFDVTLLTASEPAMGLEQALFLEGRATPYFESLWNGVALDLGKDALDVNVILEDQGTATPEFETLFEDLIT